MLSRVSAHRWTSVPSVTAAPRTSSQHAGVVPQELVELGLVAASGATLRGGSSSSTQQAVRGADRRQERGLVDACDEQQCKGERGNSRHKRTATPMQQLAQQHDISVAVLPDSRHLFSTSSECRAAASARAARPGWHCRRRRRRWGPPLLLQSDHSNPPPLSHPPCLFLVAIGTRHRGADIGTGGEARRTAAQARHIVGGRPEGIEVHLGPCAPRDSFTSMRESRDTGGAASGLGSRERCRRSSQRVNGRGRQHCSTFRSSQVSPGGSGVGRIPCLDIAADCGAAAGTQQRTPAIRQPGGLCGEQRGAGKEGILLDTLALHWAGAGRGRVPQGCEMTLKDVGRAKT